MAQADGSYGRLLARIAWIDVLVLDDWDSPVRERERRDFHEVLEDRPGERSTIITSDCHDRFPLQGYRRAPALALDLFFQSVHLR